MVIDTSAILALFFGEPHAEWIAQQLAAHRGELKMSTVNLAEALIRIRDRQPTLADEVEAKLLSAGIQYVPPSVEQARIAAEARLQYRRMEEAKRAVDILERLETLGALPNDSAEKKGAE